MVTKRELVQAVLDGKTVVSGNREYRFDEERGFVYRDGAVWSRAAWHLGFDHEYKIRENTPSLTLREAIENPGSGARMRESLKVLAKEWRRRGGAENSTLFQVDGLHSNVDSWGGGFDRARQGYHQHLVANMPLSLFQKQLVKFGACPEGLEWAGLFSTAREAWEACEHEGWMLWLINQFSLSVGDECDVKEMSYYSDDVRKLVPFERLRKLSRGK